MDDYGNDLSFYFSVLTIQSDWRILTNRWYVSTSTYGGIADYSDCCEVQYITKVLETLFAFTKMSMNEAILAPQEPNQKARF